MMSQDLDEHSEQSVESSNVGQRQPEQQKIQRLQSVTAQQQSKLTIGDIVKQLRLSSWDKRKFIEAVELLDFVQDNFDQESFNDLTLNNKQFQTALAKYPSLIYHPALDHDAGCTAKHIPGLLYDSGDDFTARLTFVFNFIKLISFLEQADNFQKVANFLGERANFQLDDDSEEVGEIDLEDVDLYAVEVGCLLNELANTSPIYLVSEPPKFSALYKLGGITT